MKFFTISLIAVVLLLAGCQTAMMIGADIKDQPLKDGIYKGHYRNGPNSAVVKVTILEGRLEDVKLLRHFSSWKGSKANTVIPQRIMAQQSTRVNAVSGATNSSIVIMNAAQKAIEQAYE